MPFSTFNSIQSFIINITNNVLSYIYNFPNITTDASLALYYPLDISNNLNLTPNYASGLPVYDASMNGSLNIINKNNYYVTGLGDLSLNNTMGSSTSNYVVSNQSFNLVPTRGLSISCWFSCSGQLNTIGTLVSLTNETAKRSIEFDISGTTNLISRVLTLMPTDYVYYFPFNDTTGFNNLGSYKSSVPTASKSSTNVQIGTIGTKSCLTTIANIQYAFFPAFGTTEKSTPASIQNIFSFGFWCYMLNNTNYQTNSICDKTFISSANVSMWQGDVYLNGYFNTYIYTMNGGSTVSNDLLNLTNDKNKWVHIFYTVNDTVFNAYVNGTLKSTVTSGYSGFRPLTNGDYWMVLGRSGDNSERYFNGCGMREFLFYNRTLSDTEVASIYNSTS